MKLRNLLPMAMIAASALSSCNTTIEKSDRALTPVSFEKVTLNDNFWLPRLQTQKKTLVPFALGKTETAVENLRRTAAYLRGEKSEKLIPLAFYVSSDLFKVMEGAAYLLTIEKDEALEKQMDDIIDIIGEAQAPDGYLYEHHIVGKELHNPRNRWGTGERPYSNVLFSHELYNMGHMYEGAIAYYRATGKRKWLDIAEKSARHINRVFFEGDSAYNDGNPVNQAPGHQEIELALVKMYHLTGDTLYLNMAKRFIDIRGVTYRPDGINITTPEYAQQHLPVREQRTAVGHAVRATYLYSGMADIAAATGDTTLIPALESVWHDIVDKKMHITGGLGAVPNIEGFGPEYLLPNKETYNETCSAVGNVFFNYRMFLMSGDAKYIDVAEVSLYNNVLAGVNLEGNRFFYVNPLEADGRKTFNHGRAGRSPWFGTACCPSNLARLIPQVPGMIYSHTDKDIFCALYAGSTVDVPLEAGNIHLAQETDYPFDGKITIEVTPAADNTEFTMWMRIPTWCTGDRFVAGELYRYADNRQTSVTATVNGKKIKNNITDGFLPIKRRWSKGDRIELQLPMPMRYSTADERVKADSNRVCITRGPLVYCAETADNQYPVSQYYLAQTAEEKETKTFTDGIMQGIPALKVEAAVATADNEVPATLTLIPYYAWNNRGDKAMNVWFARDAATARIRTMFAGNIANIKASFTYNGDDERAIGDGKRPTSSADGSIPRWTSWPQRGKEQQVEITLKKKQKIESVSVYWYNDNGGVKFPVSWRMEYSKDGKWHEFRPYVTDAFGTAGDQFNMVHPAEEIETEALLLHITPRKDAAAGILEVIIEEAK